MYILKIVLLQKRWKIVWMEDDHNRWWRRGRCMCLCVEKWGTVTVNRFSFSVSFLLWLMENDRTAFERKMDPKVFSHKSGWGMTGKWWKLDAKGNRPNQSGRLSHSGGGTTMYSNLKRGIKLLPGKWQVGIHREILPFDLHWTYISLPPPVNVIVIHPTFS